MMQELALSLIQKNVIRTMIEVEAAYDSAGFDLSNRKKIGQFYVNKIGYEDGVLIFELSSVIDGRTVVSKIEDIKKVEGMTPERLASVYDLKVDGTDEKIGRKRGRKPKVRTEVLTYEVKRKGPRIKIRKA